MCQMSFLHTKNNELNKLLFLLMGSVGSTVHDDGWGMTNSAGDSWKCDLPLWATWNAGEKMEKMLDEEYSPLMGHIRKASISVPVNEENAHPFRSESKQILFQHNGTLKPKEEKNFVLEFDETKHDEKTKTTTTKKVKISDSIIFFNKFQEIYVGEKSFEDALRETMALFYGKFAFMFYNLTTQQFHIVRGKTADLYISYLMESDKKDATVIGYIVNTSKDMISVCTNLVSNIYQIQKGMELHFSSPVLLEEESIYIAEEFGLTRIGEIKEGNAPITYPSYNRQGNSNFWGNKSEWDGYEDSDDKKVEKKTSEAKYAEQILTFMQEYCLAFKDIQYLILFGYESSMLEIDENIVKHFCDKVIPRFKSLVPKEIRKSIKKLMAGEPVTSTVYTDPTLNMEYPWMLNDEATLKAFIAAYTGKDN